LWVAGIASSSTIRPIATAKATGLPVIPPRPIERSAVPGAAGGLVGFVARG